MTDFTAFSDDKNVELEKLSEYKNENSGNIKNNAIFASFASANELENVAENGDEFIGGDAFGDVTNLFDADFDYEVYDSGDKASAEESIGPPAKTFEELSAAVTDLLKVMGSNAGSSSAEDRQRARRALGELQGTDLFAQVEQAAGGSGSAALMRRELEKMWDQEYESGDSAGEGAGDSDREGDGQARIAF
jgi:hypothetical protein